MKQSKCLQCKGWLVLDADTGDLHCFSCGRYVDEVLPTVTPGQLRKDGHHWRWNHGSIHARDVRRAEQEGIFTTSLIGSALGVESSSVRSYLTDRREAPWLARGLEIGSRGIDGQRRVEFSFRPWITLSEFIGSFRPTAS